MQDYHPPFLPSTVYHIYNHANGDDDLFREDDNYRYFLEKYKKYIPPIADTHAYCLMKNHFHLMVRIKDESRLLEFFDINDQDLTGFENLSGLISLQFSKLFNSYAKAFNNKYNRMGGLINRPVKRKPINNDHYYTELIVYIHNNPVHHGFVDDISHWLHSSYTGIMNSTDSMVNASEIMEWFGSKEAFLEAHGRSQPLKSVFD